MPQLTITLPRALLLPPIRIVKKSYFQGKKGVTNPISIGSWVRIFALALVALAACVWAIAYAMRPKTPKRPEPVESAPYYIDIDPDAGWLDFGEGGAP